MFQSKDWLAHALTHNIETIISEEELRNRLQEKKKLRIKFGVDVTNPLIHLGNAVNLWKMREFQEHGHQIVFLIGDFTSRIGDPTGKSKTRPQRSVEEIEKDAQGYIEQVTTILLNDPAVFEVRRNSEWYKTMSLDQFLGLCGKITHSKLIQRDMFQKRIQEQEEIYMHEMLYPILQGYDSYMLQSDLTVIGNDQLFNELIGRHYQSLFEQKPQIIMTTVITPGIDGKEKQSKSLGNFIALSDHPKEKFGKIMSLPDDLVILYYRVYTFVDPNVIAQYQNDLSQGKNPRDIKMNLARDIVALYHGDEVAHATQEEFVRVFSQKGVPDDIRIVSAKKGESWDDFLVRTKLLKSKSEAKRLIQAGGVEQDGKKINPQESITTSGVVKIGKTKFIQVDTEK